MDFQFQQGYLVFLVLIPAFFFWFRLKKIQASEAVLRRIGQSQSKQGSYALWERRRALLLAISMLLVVFALMKPVGNPQDVEGIQVRQDIVILLDASRSMLSRDIVPNRLGKAKEMVADMVSSLEGERVALILFSGGITLKSPLTSDYYFFLKALEQVTPESVAEGGTNLADAIASAAAVMFTSSNTNQEVNRNILLISDGDNLGEDPLNVAKEMAAKNVVINTVSIGSDLGGKIPLTESSTEYLKYKGKDVLSIPDKEALRRIADLTGGVFIPAGSAKVDLAEIYQNYISLSGAQEIEASSKTKVWTHYYQYFLFPALLILLIEPFLFNWLKWKFSTAK